MGSEGGRLLALSFLANAVRGAVRDVRIVGLEGAAHAVKADADGERALVCCVGEDQTGRAAGVDTKGDRVENGENGFAKTNHVVVRGWANDERVALPRCLKERDDI